MSATARPLIGRDDELRAIDRLLDARDELPGAVVLHGQAGIGKTSVWLAGTDAASSRGYRPLTCRTSESETTFSYAGRADLLDPVVDAALPELPPIQRRALETALLLDESDAQVDERAVAAAFLAALRQLAAHGPLVIAVDDVQWLDPASLAVVRFALSRLGDEPLAVVLTARGDPPALLRRAVPEARLVEVEIGGLSVGALHELLRERLDASFPRPRLLRLWETSGGNPFFALELADALRERGETLAPGEALPIPSTLDELLHERLAGLSPSALEVALDRAWALAIIARCRGLLLAARGEVDGAFASFERALAEHARDVDPFSRARTLLALGRTQRRAKRRGAARATLEDALARLEALGAPLWAAQTRAELARIGGRAPSRGDLTEAERRIGALVAEGKTNKEVAAAPVPHPAFGRDGAHTHLSQARRALSGRARASGPANT